jgi:hypothetical protein
MESKLSQYTDFAELLQSATQQVFSTMLGMEIEGGAIESENPPPIPDAGIVAMVGIAGAVSGNVCIRISNPLACRLASGLLMMECEQVDGDVLDAVAEIANMIVGYIARSPTLGDRFTLSFFCVHGETRDSLTIQMCLITERTNNSYLKELAELHSKLS